MTKLPDLRVSQAKGRQDILEARESDKKAKEAMKLQKDKGKYVRPHNIGPGDQVLLLRRRTTKHEGPYDPEPFTVTDTKGTQIRAEREGEVKKRDSQRWKKVEVRPGRSFKVPKDQETEAKKGYREDTDIGATRCREQGDQGRQQGRAPQPPGDQGRQQGRAPTPPGDQGRQQGRAPSPPGVQDQGSPPPGDHRGRPRDRRGQGAREDIRQRLRRDDNVIIAETEANRPKRRREAPKAIYTPSGQGMRSRSSKTLPPPPPL